MSRKTQPRRTTTGQSRSNNSPSRSGANSPRHQGGGKPIRPSQPRDKARWVVGLHSCDETLKIRPKAIRELLLREDYLSSQALREIADKAEKNRVPIRKSSPGQLDQIGTGHQGVALAVLENPQLDESRLAAPGPCVILALDGIEDPHNLGAMLRTGWLAGVAAIYIPEDRAVGLTPAACKVASGGAEHVPVEACTNLPSELLKLKDHGFWIYGLSEKGTGRPWDLKLPEKVIWVIGSEGSGMRVPIERACDELVRLPQAESGSSYNASIAAAMALSETCRQLGTPQ